jgi:hypothetical protein
MLAKCVEFPNVTCFEHASAAPVVNIRNVAMRAASTMPIGSWHVPDNHCPPCAGLDIAKALCLSGPTVHDFVVQTLMQIKCG